MIRTVGICVFAATLVASPRPAAFREHLIAQDLKGGYQIVVIDMNKDGRPDLVALASGLDQLVWFENPGWKRHVIGSGFLRMINMAARDWDGDGVPEIVLAHEFANQAKNSIGVVSVLESQADPDAEWKATEIDRLTTSHRLRWADIRANKKPALINAPLTGVQAEAPEYRGPAPLVYYETEDWIRHHITGGESKTPPDEGVVHGMHVIDWDGDGREDVMTASFSGIHLYRFDGKGWTRTQLVKGDPSPSPRSGSSDVTVGRFGGGRFLAAIEPWHGHQVSVYLPANEGFVRTVIDSTLVDGHTILAGDFNQDGVDEVVAGYRGQGRSVYLYYAQDKTGKKWKRETVDNGGLAAAACASADLNGDGRVDLVCIGSATANMKWYENSGVQ